MDTQVDGSIIYLPSAAAKGKGTESLSILSIGSLDRTPVVREALASISNLLCYHINQSRDVAEIPSQPAIQLVMANETLSPNELEDTCTQIRRRWPKAQILVIRSGPISLDDALYDERVVPSVTVLDLASLVGRLVHLQHNSTRKGGQ